MYDEITHLEYYAKKYACFKYPLYGIRRIFSANPYGLVFKVRAVAKIRPYVVEESAGTLALFDGETQVLVHELQPRNFAPPTPGEVVANSLSMSDYNKDARLPPAPEGQALM